MLDGHVAAAAFEAPVDDADRATLGDEALERAPYVPELQHTKHGWVWAGKDYPAARTPLRSASADSFTVIDGTTGTVLGIVERERAYSTVHEGAVYLHLGEQWLVRELDLVARHAVVEPHSGDWYTQVKKDTSTDIEQPLRTERRLGLELTFGNVSVTERVVAYQRKSIRDQATIATVELDLPPTVFETEAVWYLPTARAARRPRRDADPDLDAARGGPAASASRSGASSSSRAGSPTRCASSDGLPVRARLPLLRPEPEVRQPERAPRQGRRADAVAQNVEIELARSS